MRGFNVLLLSTALLAPLALAPTGNAQISININVPPSCSYGYYGYAPYACAPSGYYGPGYFYNGIFLEWAHGPTGATVTAGEPSLQPRWWWKVSRRWRWCGLSWTFRQRIRSTRKQQGESHAKPPAR